MLKKWQLKDVILLAFLSIFFGGVFVGSGYVYNILSLLLTPLGLQAFANEILFGLWCMAAPIAAIFVPRVGSATIGEVLAALAEVLYGSQFGLGALLSGLVQGLGSEFGFIVTKNRYESWLSLTANSIGITLVSFVYEYIKLGYYAFSLPFVLSLLVVRFISVYFFCTILVRAIVKLYHQFATGGYFINDNRTPDFPNAKSISSRVS
ncbi:cobalt ABC transporter permease [Streptococcus pneumoniae]|nr:ECF transporter S component [Streptococcus pneumoniae]CMW67914.1 cobalt ABC transporter permease [Streptococcus pneumoniae]